MEAGSRTSSTQSVTYCCPAIRAHRHSPSTTVHEQENGFRSAPGFKFLWGGARRDERLFRGSAWIGKRMEKQQCSLSRHSVANVASLCGLCDEGQDIEPTPLVGLKDLHTRNSYSIDRGHANDLAQHR